MPETHSFLGGTKGIQWASFLKSKNSLEVQFEDATNNKASVLRQDRNLPPILEPNGLLKA